MLGIVRGTGVQFKSPISILSAKDIPPKIKKEPWGHLGVNVEIDVITGALQEFVCMKVGFWLMIA